MIGMQIEIQKEIDLVKTQRVETILKEVQDLNQKGNQTLREMGVKTLKERDLIKILDTEMVEIVIGTQSQTGKGKEDITTIAMVLIIPKEIGQIEIQ